MSCRPYPPPTAALDEKRRFAKPRDTAWAMSVQKVQLLREATDAFNRRDGAAFDALLARGAEIVPVRAALEGTVYRGADAGSQYCAAVDKTWDSLSWKIEESRRRRRRSCLGAHPRQGTGQRCRHRHICGVGRPLPRWTDRSLWYLHRPWRSPRRRRAAGVGDVAAISGTSTSATSAPVRTENAPTTSSFQRASKGSRSTAKFLVERRLRERRDPRSRADRSQH